MKNKIITVSREFGSGGRTVGRKTAKKLGICCYDQELIAALAKESGFTEDYVMEYSESARHSGWLSAAFSDRSMNGMSAQDYLWVLQCRIILELAQKESCIIVGRCADYILRDSADCLRVFIHAEIEKRAERIVSLYGETDQSPLKRLSEKDKRRAAYYEFYTDMQWGVAQNYHLALDSGALGIDRCVSIISELY